MQEVKQYPAGTFSWIDLITPDPTAAKHFYGQLFGWEAHDMPTDQDGVYTMLTLHGKDVAGMTAMSPEQSAQHIPPYWMSYISVDDVQAITERAQGLGATILAPPFPVMEAGWMAVLQDPTGAAFALWEPRQHIGARLVNQPNTLCWNELTTRDVASASAFYHGLFGWEVQMTPSPAGDYISFTNQGRMAAGMLTMPAEWGEMPPAWGVYLAVADCDATVQQAQELGGKVMMPPTDVPETGRMAVLQDPQGAVFSVIKMDAADPPPGYAA